MCNKSIERPNVIVSDKKAKDNSPAFYVSYLEQPLVYGCPTTAIVIEETQQFLILKGDHSEQLKELPFQQALDYFYKNLEQAHKFSEHGKIFKLTEGKKGSYVKGGY